MDRTSASEADDGSSNLPEDTMEFVADLHIHSKYSRAVSKDMVLEELDRWAADKGILVMGTGDFTHPDWFREIQTKLEPAEPGLLKLKEEYKLPTINGKRAETRFLLTVELSSIYPRGGRVRRIHNLIFVPDLPTAAKLNTQLSWIGNLKSDGRPILGLDSEELAKTVFATNPDSLLVPAHAWTPWFSVFGSMSGFDSIEECFGEYAKHIFAIESGLSSDPAMNWRLSKLDRLAVISNSDSHSLARIGREANVFDTDLSYQGIAGAIKGNDPARFKRTLEFFPEEGKYHFDGHRLCGVSWSPEETKEHQGRCTACGRPVTVGVLNRVDQLADRPPEYRDQRRVPYVHLVTLDQIIAEALGVGKASKKTMTLYETCIKTFGSELFTLLQADLGEIARVHPLVAEGVGRVRAGKLAIQPGYDGEYGRISIFNDSERQKLEPQKSLF